MVDVRDIKELKRLLEKIGDDVGIKVSELQLDKTEVLGFYAHGKDDLREFGNQIINSDLIMDCLSSESINKIIVMAKDKLTGIDEAKAIELAAASALTSLLALSRAEYLEAEREQD